MVAIKTLVIIALAQLAVARSCKNHVFYCGTTLKSGRGTICQHRILSTVIDMDRLDQR